MVELTKQDFKKRFNEQVNWGLNGATELGQCIIDRAKWCEETGREHPFLIAEIKTHSYHIQLTYTGLLGDLMSFSLVDLYSPEGGSHGYPKLFFGDTRAFFMEIIRELNYITELHESNR